MSTRRSLPAALAVAVAVALVGTSSVARAQQQRSCTLDFPNVPGVTRQVGVRIDSTHYNYFFGGGVVAVCRAEDMTLRADSAEVYGLEGRVYLIGHVRYDEPRAHMTSDFLTYYSADERAVAQGNVFARLPSGSTMSGPEATYLRATAGRPLARLTATGRPALRLVESRAPAGAAPARRPTAADTTPTIVNANTIVSVGDSLIYGSQNVDIVRPDLTARSDSLFMDTGLGLTALITRPRIESRRDRPYSLTGTLIDLYSNRQRQLQRVVARGAATAVSQDVTLRSDTIDLRVANDLLQRAIAWGPGRANATSATQDLLADSLDVTMPGQRLQLVRAVRKAYAESVPDSTRIRTAERDWLRGDTITARFDTTTAGDTTHRAQVKSLTAVGEARSYYHLAPQDTALHRPALNYVTGVEITVSFVEGKVSTVNVEGQQLGVYLEPRADTTTAPAAATPGQPTRTPMRTPRTTPTPRIRPGGRP